MITCVFCAASLNQPVDSYSSHVSFLVRDPLAKYRGLLVGQKNMYFSYTQLPRARRPYGPANGENWDSDEFIRQFKISELSVYPPDCAPIRRAQCHKLYPPYMLTGNHVQSDGSTNIERQEKSRPSRESFAVFLVGCFLRWVKISEVV